MIARFRALLPFTMSVRDGDAFPPRDFRHDSYRVRIHPPVEATIDASSADLRGVPLRQVIERLLETGTSAARPAIKIDGQPTTPANLLQIDFYKDDFDRRWPAEMTMETLWQGGDPSPETMFRIANGFLARIRTVVRGPYIRYLTPNSCFWRLDYLADDETELVRQKGFMRWRLGAPLPASANPMYASAWEKVNEAPPGYIPPTWDTLLLDAYAALPPADSLIPQVGAAIVLAFAALETFIAASLNELARTSAMSRNFWEWLNQRDGDLDRQPSVEEKFDQLLRHFSEHSLKEDERLWTAFKELRNARNKFVHEGVARVGDLHVSTDRAKTLVTQAEEIVDWVERLLPEGVRRPKLAQLPTLTFRMDVGLE